MRNLIFIGVFIFSLVSCGNKEAEEKPSDILSEEKMVAVLIDMYSLEGKLIQGQLIVGEAYEKGMKEYLLVFDKHGTNKEQVEKSIDYYVHHPEVMKKLQIQVLDSLNVRSR